VFLCVRIFGRISWIHFSLLVCVYSNTMIDNVSDGSIVAFSFLNHCAVIHSLDVVVVRFLLFCFDFI